MGKINLNNGKGREKESKISSLVWQNVGQIKRKSQLVFKTLSYHKIVKMFRVK